ncbi:adenylyl-sulfate kinase [Candidatus Parcubacteria bacterium]|nr:adenylyl-sulfate kinase [Candidatus Parcubacteria bacterium]
MIIWFTGLSGVGKTTLSAGLKKKLGETDFSVFQVDGDIVRKEQNIKNTFSKEEILENNYNIISYCESIKKDYDFIIVSVISPFQETRAKAREMFKKDYLEIFLSCPLKELLKRDPKKLYARMLAGEIKNLIGFSEQNPYEVPKNPDIMINTEKDNIEKSLEKIINVIKNNNYDK